MYCEGFVTADAPAGSYHLPNVVELATLIDNGAHEPAISSLFVGAAADGYWSSTPVVSGMAQGWTVRFDFGEIVPALATHGLRSRCVRGTYAAGRLHASGALRADGGRLVDEESGLEWEAHPTPDRYTWSQALLHCASLEVDGEGGFHLPNQNELRSLLDYGASTPVRSDPEFTDLVPDTYWSSTPTFGIESLVQSISFNLGVQDGVSVDSPAYAVCVRHLPAPPEDTPSDCGCHVGGTERGGDPHEEWWLLGLVAVVAVRRRRRG